MDIVRTEHAIGRRDDDFVLGPVDIRLAPEQVLAVTGPRGAGKTTLMRLLWGFLRPDEGRVRVFGRPPHLEQVWVRLRAGYVGESPAFCDGMTGRQYLEFTAGFYPAWDWTHAHRLAEALSVDIGKSMVALSKEERLRLGLIAALTHRPRLLILDSPACGLEPASRTAMLHAVGRVTAREGTAVVVSARSPDGLEGIADTILALDRGRVLRRAPVDETDSYCRHGR